jgi:hypothetical protein
MQDDENAPLIRFESTTWSTSAIELTLDPMRSSKRRPINPSPQPWIPFRPYA